MSREDDEKFPDYTGLPVSDTSLIVQKSNPLLALSESKFTLNEFKILDAYLARIDSHNPEKRYVRFSKGELERIFGVGRIRKEYLSQRLDNLFQPITLEDDSQPGRFVKIALFEKALSTPDEHGVWQVDLVCTESARKYIFNIESKGYLQYMLKNVMDIDSRYTYLMYLYLERNRFRSKFRVPIDKLKKILGCEAQAYQEFKHFNDLVLKKCYYDIHARGLLNYEYQPTTRVGRAYTEIEFTILPGNKQPEVDSFIPTELLSEKSEAVSTDGPATVDYGSALSNMLGNNACKNEFSKEEVTALRNLVLDAVSSVDGKDMCDYLERKIELMNQYAQRSTIKDRFAYLCAMIKNDIAEKQAK